MTTDVNRDRVHRLWSSTEGALVTIALATVVLAFSALALMILFLVDLIHHW